MTKLHQLAELGQAVWLDYVRRSFITSGDLQALIEDGLRGVTSNPSIFEKAIAGSGDYDEQLHRLVDAGKTPQQIYQALTLDDIARAADLLRPVYDRTDGLDGYVSLEVNPNLAYDTEGTIAEARRLFTALDRPNVMIKVPATKQGLPAIETLIAEGVNVNVTLIFAVDQYRAVTEAYLTGLERLVESGGDVGRVASVASFFVSRLDVAVDRELERMPYSDLMGQAAIANGKVAYGRFREIFDGDRWQALAAQGARVQRVLWASTSTKNPAYSDTLYVDALIGPDTVNTLPPATLNAFRDHGAVAPTLEQETDQACILLDQLASLGINLEAITDKLLEEGVDKFAQSFDSLMETIAQKRDRLLSGWMGHSANLGQYQPAVDEALDELDRQRIVPRIWKHDHTVWQPQPTEIVNRLGWLHIAELMAQAVPRMEALADEVKQAGYERVLLLGMGGSSLAPELFSRVFGPQGDDGLRLDVLDSTTPGAVSSYAAALDLSRTLFIVATKSGGTAETLSFFKYFYTRTVEELGADEAGQHFIGITDPGSSLTDIADQYNFRALVLNDPTIGGRFSALSYFGLVPATLAGVDISRLLDRALTRKESCVSCISARENDGARLGAIMGTMAQVGRDKITFVVSQPIASFGDWVEQLIAESTGKRGHGILPVVGETLGDPTVYGDDRLFVHVRLAGDDAADEALVALEAAGHPVVRFNLRDVYDLGEQFFLWEFATAVVSYFLEINPFNQPNVEAAKLQARKMIAEYQQTGELRRVEPAPLSGEALRDFLAQAAPGDYVALQAYVRPTPETSRALDELRLKLRDRYHLATTVGYGPRFLHSTGQLHKGDAGNGLFIQFASDPTEDVPIPDQAGQPLDAASITFGVLVAAQALGDRQALLDADRRVICFHLGQDVVDGLETLAQAV